MTITAQSSNSQAAFLITSRKFPQDSIELESVLTKMYTEVAQGVNFRTIGLYELTQITIGDKYFNTGDPQNRRQAFRKVFTLSSIAMGTNTIPLGFTLQSNNLFVHIYGVANNPTVESVPIPFVNSIVPGDDIDLRIDWPNNQIIITTTTGNWVDYSAIIVLEYLLN
jgi:hypothetical protein